MKICRDIKDKFKPRPRHSHKGDFGRIFILAGSKGYTGAAHLAAQGALRSGGALVTLGVPESIYPIAARREAEIMVRPFRATPEGSLSVKAFPAIKKFMQTQEVLAIGPGLSQHPGISQLVQRLLSCSSLPQVIDADGLNALVGRPGLLGLGKGRTVVTPHPGEFARLFGGKKPVTADERKRRALEVSKSFGAVVVLKGHRTVIASPDGRCDVNSTGNPGMATGGTGDVLTGIIAALIGQKFSCFDAARFGVFFHGLAGDLAAKKIGEISLTAGDVLDYLPRAFQKILGSK